MSNEVQQQLALPLVSSLSEMFTKSLFLLTGAISASAAQFRLASTKDNWNIKHQPSVASQNVFSLFSEERESSTDSDITPAFDYDLLVCKDSYQELSCTNETTAEDLCCFEHPGGLILLTQFWDTNPGTGPADAFTVHGLWPDNCDGTYEQYCNPDLEIDNATQVLLDFEEHDLLDAMNTYWKSSDGNDSSFWEHEFNKHATCYSTLKPECYGENYKEHAEAIDYFKMTFNLFDKLPTYQWLQSEGIVPSNEATYTKQDIIDALSKNFGFIPYIACDDDGAIDEVWYYFYAFGSLRNQNFQAIDSIVPSKSCPDKGIKYLEKYPAASSDSNSNVDSKAKAKSTITLISTSTTTSYKTSTTTSTSTALEFAKATSLGSLKGVSKATSGNDAPSCPLDLPYSCTNNTIIEDTCCFEHPGGVILSTQFWDYSPAIGPADAFTLHGLWPDNCDGSFEQFCNKSLEISNPADIVSSFDEELLTHMRTYWKDYKGKDDSLWYHEYNKHGTCLSTIQPTCYGSTYDASTREDVYDYFRKAVDLYNGLPTYEWLAADGITPSETETYTYDQIIKSLSKNHGATPFVKCDSSGALNEVWYFHHLQGSLKDGRFNPIDTLSPNSRCPSTGVKFVPKGSKAKPTATRTSTGPAPTASDGSTKGYVTLSDQQGCLIRNGHWYTTGSCATYTLTPLSTGSYTLKNSGGYCTLTDNIFTCGSSVTSPFEFDYDPEENVFSANGQSTWSTDAVPKGSSQSTISLGTQGEVTFKLQWKRV